MSEAELFALRNEPGARDELVGRYRSLSKGIAFRYRSQAEIIDDLIQVADLGLVAAVMKYAPRLARELDLAHAFEVHRHETAGHEQRVRERMDQLGHSPSRIKDATGLAGGLGMLLFARSQPDTPGKLAAHAYSYEHMEIAAYGILAAYADRSGDRETAELARRIESEERAMAGRISERFGEAVSAALIGRTTTLDRLLARYVADLHAIEAQGRQLCARTMGMVDHPELAGILNRQLRDGWVQQAVWKRDLEDLGDGPSTLKDLPLALGGNFVATFLLAQPDPNTKVAGFAFAFQNLLAGSCEMLERVARLAGEDTIAAQAESRAAAVRNSANRISKLWEQLGGV